MAALNGVLVIGCGKMGGSILNGFLAAGADKSAVRVVEPNAEIRENLAKRGITAFENIAQADGFSPAVVFTAVKPFLIADVIGGVKPFTDKGAVLFTIVAGKPIAFYETHLGKQAAIVRAMPNTPAAIGKGITGLIANSNASESQKRAVAEIAKACGEAVWLTDESQIDAVTAVSGSGPAYLFYLTEALSAAAKSLGLADDTAEKLAKATVIGSAALMEQSTETPAKLRQNVTTPNGTTAAALDVLMNPETGFEPLMTQAVKAAENRSKELGK